MKYGPFPDPNLDIVSGLGLGERKTPGPLMRARSPWDPFEWGHPRPPRGVPDGPIVAIHLATCPIAENRNALQLTQ
jgi:hypothetical protein